MTLAALEWLGEEVEDDGRDAGPGRGRAAVAGVGGPRPVSVGGREDHARVGAGDVARPLTLDERLDAGLFGAVEPALPFTDTEWVDPAEGIA